MNRILKALASSFGGGLALGAGIKIGQASVNTRARTELELDPLLQRLDAVEGRIVRLESSVRVQPSTPGSSTAGPNFSTQDLQALSANIRSVDRKIDELETRLAGLIRGVSERVDEVYVNLRREIEEVHNRAVQVLVDTLQNQVMQRMSVIETGLTEQSKAIGALRQSSMRTDQSLQKMLAGIEQLRDQSRPPSPVANPVISAPRMDREESSARPHPLSFELVESQTAPLRRWRTPLTIAMLGVLMLSGFGFASRFARKRSVEAQASTVPVSTVASNEKPGEANALLEQGREYIRQQDWVQAESAYRTVLEANPQNREAALGLTDVLYHQHKYEESAAVLNRRSNARL